MGLAAIETHGTEVRTNTVLDTIMKPPRAFFSAIVATNVILQLQGSASSCIIETTSILSFPKEMNDYVEVRNVDPVNGNLA